MSLDRLSVLMRANNHMDIRTIITYIGVAFILTFIIFLVYKVTYTGVAYSSDFNISIVLTGMITAVIMMVIGNNLALSLGMVGALSIVRFRAAIKEPKDISYIFWSITVGLSAGTGALAIAVIGTLAITCTIIFYRIGMFKQRMTYLLVINSDRIDHDLIEDVVKTNTKKYRLKVKNTRQDEMESIFEVNLVSKGENKLLDMLYTVNGVNSVNIVAFNGYLNE